MTTLTMDAERLREESNELQPLVAMFASEGWRKLSLIVEDKAKETRAKLLLPSGVQSIEEVYAQRERYAVFSWLLDLPQEKTSELELKREQLFEIEQREGS